ncbi:MAG: hypothetical protein JXQ29_00845, partial [Planctomycetes bacterium]|nr:hypothetical protein [Planctomycetota bacterium]
MCAHRFGFLVAVVLLLASASAASGQDAAAEKVLLRYQFKPGEEQRYTLTGEGKTNASMPPGGQKETGTLSGSLAIFAAEVDAETKSALVGFGCKLTGEMKTAGKGTEDRTDTLRMLQVGR